ncbi:MAG TPA: penicillin-binding transpeptidase domain-containing protein [Dermatophilaceae bacterium]|nr:penicillin-binding transpeptidase domain-containing protein [Dermatophilaceae bacterium]
MRSRSVIAAALALLLVAAAAGGGWWWWQREERARDAGAQRAVTAYAAAWTAKDVGAVPFADPAARADFPAATAGLGDAPVAVRAGDVERNGGTATSTLDVTWTLPGSTAWRYAVPVTVQDRSGTWVVAAPREGSYWHPDIKVGDTMTAERVSGTRGDLLDRGGAALMPTAAVYPVQLDPTRATPAAAKGLEEITGEPAGSLVAKLQAAQKAGSKAPIPVITYREADFAARRDRLDALTGVIYPRTEQPLGPTRTFGQPLLGSFGEVTEEVVTASDGRYADGDRAGLSGLQGQYDATLAGTPGVRVVSSTAKVLFEKAATDGTDVRTSLDRTVQEAAESALTATGTTPSALVALDVRSGQVLAVANSPSSGFDRAVTGRYAPGSAFKVTTSYAYLTRGITSPEASVPCPPTVVVDGRSFRNYEGEALGAQTFGTDFAKSCNTAFIGLAGQLGDDDLTVAGAALGIGADWARTLGVDDAFVGSVPRNNGETDKAAAAIGQGRVEVSPMALAVMAGSVARGSYVPPVLVQPDGQGEPQPTALDTGAAADIRSMMREVVTDGTAPVLKDTPGGPVSGKTGTAEFGDRTPPQTRAWFTGFQGAVAFAVLVEEGKSGGSVAAPVAKRFLSALSG